MFSPQQIGALGASFIKSSPWNSVSTYSASLKFYFTVSSSYCVHKLKLLFWPFNHRSFAPRRRIVQDQRFSPSEDINAPDFYIGFVSLLFCVLTVAISCFTATLSNSSAPSFSKYVWKVFWSLFFAVIIKKSIFAVFPTSFPSPSLFDLVAYFSYSFPFTALLRFCSLWFPLIITIPMLIYSVICYCYYIFYTSKALVPDSTNYYSISFSILGALLILITWS
ncbi:hypothetical protein RCL1_005137 [Eukaryota sp. TZLM3-RCL]